MDKAFTQTEKDRLLAEQAQALGEAGDAHRIIASLPKAIKDEIVAITKALGTGRKGRRATMSAIARAPREVARLEVAAIARKVHRDQKELETRIRLAAREARGDLRPIKGMKPEDYARLAPAPIDSENLSF